MTWRRGSRASCPLVFKLPWGRQLPSFRLQQCYKRYGSPVRRRYLSCSRQTFKLGYSELHNSANGPRAALHRWGTYHLSVPYRLSGDQ